MGVTYDEARGVLYVADDVSNTVWRIAPRGAARRNSSGDTTQLPGDPRPPSTAPTTRKLRLVAPPETGMALACIGCAPLVQISNRTLNSLFGIE